MRLFYNSLWKSRWNKISKLKIIFESESEVAQSCPTLCDPTRLLYPKDFPDKSTGVGYHFFLQEIFPIQGLNPGLPHLGRYFTDWATIVFNANIKFKLLGAECLNKVILIKVDNFIRRLPWPNGLKVNASKFSKTRLSQGYKNYSRA